MSPRLLLAIAASALALVMAGGVADARSVAGDGPLALGRDPRRDLHISSVHPVQMGKAPYHAVDIFRFGGRRAEVAGRHGYLVRMKVKDLWADAHPSTDPFTEQFYFSFYDGTHAAELMGFKAGGRIGAGMSHYRGCRRASLDYQPRRDIVRLFVPATCLRHRPTRFSAEAGLLTRQWPHTYISSDETAWVDFR